MNNYPAVYIFICGTISILSLVVAAFFMKFWRKTRDSFFIFFSLAFGIIGLERIVLLFEELDAERRPLVYFMRLMAFLMIIFAVISKNRGGSK